MKYLSLISLLLISSIVFGQNYYVYVTAESEDEVALLRFDGKEFHTEKTVQVGVWPAEIEGPHGINVSPDGKYWYLTLAHGNPFGTLNKYSTETNELIEKVELGLFPATMAISTMNGLGFCVNFNLHGDMVPSSVSVIDLETMTELKKIDTGTMPHGSRITSDGRYHYSVAMMSGELFEINTMNLEVSRILNLDKNEAVSTKAPEHDHAAMMAGKSDMQAKDEHAGHNMMSHSKVKPTWAIPHPTQAKVYVAGNGSNEILEIDRKDWTITRRFDGGKAPYNVEITPDGKLFVVTYKGEGGTGIWDIKKGKEVGRIKNTTSVSHGVAISSDSKYAFISVEGKGGEPGKVDVIDLKQKKMVSSAAVGKQAGGIIFWKVE